VAADLQLERVSYVYPGGSSRALADLDLGIEAGSYAVVFGSNGSGKSTFAVLPNGLIPHVVGGALTGRVAVRGRDTRDHRPAALFELAGLVFQNPEAQLFSSTVGDELAFGLENLGLAPEAVAGRIRETAERLGIVELLARPPEALSGGEQRLAAIASVVAMAPPIVILDEPFAGLDWRFAPRVAAILAELNRSGTTVVVIEHRAGDYLRDAARLFVFDRGRVALDGPGGSRAEPALKANRLLPEYPPLPPTGAAGEEVLAVDALSASIGGRPVLEGVSFALRAGEVAALVGENGAGKSTLVRHLIGLSAPASGSVRLRGRPTGGRPPSELAREIGICFQNPDDQFFTTSVRAEIEIGLRRGRPGGLGLEDLSGVFELGAVLDRPPHRLSAGEKKRAAIASVLALNPEVLVLDEPTAGQDAVGREALATALRRLSAEGLAVLAVTHDLEFASACARRWIRLHGGRVASDGPPRESGLPLPGIGALGGRTIL
jgi:energy-coupling factor transport system ATP-binding protein